MVNITKAIIHILNPEQGITIQSRNELDITSGTTYQYVNSLIEKAFNISQLKFGNFASNSTVLSLIRQYKNNESEFGEISRTISERMSNRYRLQKRVKIEFHLMSSLQNSLKTKLSI